jgi:uncharacterized protein YfiM (DUF2279 family)
MKKINFPLKNAVLLFLWLSFLVQSSWADPTQVLSSFDGSSQSDTLRIADKWFARDKAEHLVVSTFLSGVSYSVFRDFYYNKEETSAYFSAILTFSVGLGKELHDMKAPRGRFSYKDIVADVLGIALGILIATR